MENGTSQGNPAGYSKGYALMSTQVSYLGEESQPSQECTKVIIKQEINMLSVEKEGITGNEN